MPGSPGLPDGIFSNLKIPFWVQFGGTCNGRYWYMLWPFGIFVAMWYILCLFGIFSPVWYVVPRKIWQPCGSLLFVSLGK
jgi:hypothetical protein